MDFLYCPMTSYVVHPESFQNNKAAVDADIFKAFLFYKIGNGKFTFCYVRGFPYYAVNHGATRKFP